MQSGDQSNEGIGFEAKRLLASARVLSRSLDVALAAADSEHAAILVAAGRRLYGHPAADRLVDVLDWHRERRRFAELAKQAAGPMSAEAELQVDRALEILMRGYLVQPIDLIARFSWDPPVELPPFDPSKFRILSLEG